MANVKISELAVNSSPSASATLAGVDGGETVQIPISKFVTKDEGGNVTVIGKATVKDGMDVLGESIFRNDIKMQGGGIDVTNAMEIRLWNETDSKNSVLYCSDDGELLLDGKAVAIKDDIPDTSNFVTKDENGDIVVHHVTTEDGIDCEGPIMVKDGNQVAFCSEDNSKKVALRCDDNGKLTLDGKAVATVDDIPSGGGNTTIGDTLRGIKEIEFDNQLGNIRGNEDGLEVMSQYELQLQGTLGIEVESTGHIAITSSTEGISINSKNTTIDGVSSIKTLNEDAGQPGQVLTTNGETVYWGTPSGGSGDSSIIDLGQHGNHKEAQQAIVDHLTQPTVTDGCYVFKYWCDCYGNACLAVVLKRTADTVYIEGTVYDNSSSYREFKYRQDMGLTVDGCWEEIGTSSGGTGLSMPRIRLANWHYTELPRISFDENGKLGQCSGEIIFSVNIQDGTVQEGDQLQVCSIRNTFGKKKLRPILSKTITAEDIENLAKQPYLQVSTEDVSGNNLAQTTSQAIGSFYHTDSKDSYRLKPKYIRIRRPIYTEDGNLANAFFSNVVPVEIVLRYEII